MRRENSITAGMVNALLIYGLIGSIAAVLFRLQVFL